jgi:hypothetical protein
MTISAFASVCFIYAFRKAGWATFSAWMDAEGWPLMIMIWFLYGGILLARGVIQ